MPEEFLCPLRRTIAVCAILVAAALSIAVMVAIVVTLQHRWAETPDKGDVFCCPDLVRILWVSSNMSVNPCYDIYKYTCYNWDSSQQMSVLEDTRLSKVVIPTYTRANTAASRTIARYYRNCLETASTITREVDSVVEAFLYVLGHPLPATAEDMLGILLRVTLGYGTSPGIWIELLDGTEGNMELQSVTWSRWAKQHQLSHRRRALEVFNRVTGSTVPLANLAGLAARVITEDDAEGTQKYSDTTVLQKILPGVAEDVWQREWYASSTFQLPRHFTHTSVQVLKSYFDVIVSGPQPTALALLVIEASVQLFLRFFADIKDSGPARACHQKSMELGLLWDVVVDETFGDPLVEDSLRKLYEIIANETLHFIAQNFPLEDVPRAQYIVPRKIYLTSDFHLHNITPPVNASGFWKRHLAIKEYERETMLFHREMNLLRYEFGAFSGTRVQLFSSPLRFLVPPIFYDSLNFTSGVDPLVNMAVAAVVFKSALHQLVDSANYSEKMKRLQDAFNNCTSQKHDSLATLRADLEFVVNVTKTATWNKPIDAWRLEMSRGQIFYMSVVFHNWCGLGKEDEAENKMKNRVMMGISDFRRVFGCPAVPTTDYCYMDYNIGG